MEHLAVLGTSGIKYKNVVYLGYTGSNCDTKCFYPSYGKDCQSICNCTEFFCDHENGCRNLTNGDFQNICKGKNGGTVCCHGYKQNKEKTECEPCEKGYAGQICEIVCPFPSYGLDCQSVCNCTETTCDHVNGCRGYSSETTMPQNSMKAVNGENFKKLSANRKQPLIMIGIGVLAAVALFPVNLDILDTTVEPDVWSHIMD
uniref:EGF-like domain-containing protein n=1 Tax=Magallana gigas TaxID=29159 RepID=K1QB77_MAGGI